MAFSASPAPDDIPYRDAALPAYRLAAVGGPSRGTALLHGGFDSLIEEFFAIWQHIATAGFDVIAFEGPRQGGARALGGLTLDHDWENPVAAVLDHFQITSAGSSGSRCEAIGRCAPQRESPHRPRCVVAPGPRLAVPSARAAPRGRTRHASAPAIHALERSHAHTAGPNPSAGDRPGALPRREPGSDGRRRLVPRDERDHLGSDRVTQDVLILCVEHDAFQPPVLARAQAGALTNARSVSVCMFTAAEHADEHCQMGNLDLACGVVTDWLIAPGPLASTAR